MCDGKTHEGNVDFVNHRNEWGQSALQNAAANGHVDIVTRLLDAKAACSANSQGNTPLHWACLMGHLECVKKLVASKADVNVRNQIGRTCLDEAYQRGHSNVFDFLAELQAQPGKQAMDDAAAENARGDDDEEEDEAALKLPTYRVPLLPDAAATVDWEKCPVATLSHYRTESKTTDPVATVQLCRLGDKFIRGRFQVRGEIVRATRLENGQEVWKDSCCEWFVQPAGSVAYINFEFNALGRVLAMVIRDPTRTETGFKDYRRFEASDYESIQVSASLQNGPIVGEEATEWSLEFTISLELLTRLLGPLDFSRAWRCNFNKCGDETKYPHWATWSPIEALEFHAPKCFGFLAFAGDE